MTNYTYLGWGTTDSNGVAKLDHDANDDPLSHSYTGSGVGEVDVVASLDKPIVSGSVVSQPYTVYDCTKIDRATSTDHNDTLYDSVYNVNRDTEYSYLTTANFVTRYISISGDICIEFDINLAMLNDSPFISVRANDTQLMNVARSRFGLSENTWYHIKVEIKNNTCTVYNPIGSTDYSLDVTGYTRLYFRKDSNETLKFKNVMIYPI